MRERDLPDSDVFDPAEAGLDLDAELEAELGDASDAGDPADDPVGDRPSGRHRPVPVLAQGDGWLVVAKPPLVIVHRNARMRHVSAVLQRVRDQVGGRVYLAHRLDRGTSGCLLLATRRELAGPLSLAIAGGTARKTYLAFVRGYFAEEGPVEVDSPINYYELGTKEASSTVERLGASHEPRCSLLRVRPHTGRHHQVRRHVRDLDHPIIGDSDHGDSRINREWRGRGSRRLGLHCIRLELTLPDGSALDVRCPLFEDQQALFQSLPFWEEARQREPDLDLPALSWDWVGPVE